MKRFSISRLLAGLQIKWQKQTLLRRIISVLLITMIPIFFIILFSASNSQEAIVEMFNSTMLDDTRKRSHILSMELDAFNDLLFQLVSEDTVIDQLSLINSTQDNVMRDYYGNSLYNMIKRYKYARDGLVQTVIIPSAGNYVSYDTSTFKTTYFDSLRSRFWDMIDELTESEYYLYFSDFYQDTGVLGPAYLEGVPEGRYVFFMGEQISNLSDLCQEGVAIFTILEDHLDEMCNLHADEALSSAFLISRGGEILTHSDDDMIGQPLKNLLGSDIGLEALSEGIPEDSIESRETQINDSRMMITFAPVSGTDFLLVSCFSYEYLDSRLDALNRTLVVALILMLLIVMLIIFKFAIGITRDVSVLAEQILKGPWDGDDGNNARYVGNELEIIVDNYHLLLDKFNAAMDSVRQSAQREKQLELRSLESQINSHFLYNTLDSINWMAIENENYEISEIIGRLATIMRYSINVNIRTVSFSQELSWLEGHLYIQRRRFSGKFTYDLSIESETVDFPMCKLTLQPFIENAVLHGVRGLDHPGRIFLSSALAHDGEFLKIIIQDNGCGMRPDEVELYYNRPETAKAQGHVGIANVLERLKHYYGEAYSLKVQSDPGKGTTVTLLLPRIKLED